MKQYLDIITNEPAQIGHWIGFDKLTGLNNKWISQMLLSSQDYTLLAHRGSYKSTCLSIAMALWQIIKPNNNIIFLRKTDEDVKRSVREVEKMLRSDTFRYLVQQIYGVELKITESTMYSLTTNLKTSADGNSQLQGIGTGSSLTGKHADWVITDDIVNLKDRISPAERKRIKMIYAELQNIKNRGGRILNTGTPWHKDDAISIMPNVQRFNCYETNLINDSDLDALRQSMSPSLFAANYELKHIADSDALFKTAAQFTDNTFEIFGGIAHIDASYGGKDGTAFTILKTQHDKNIMFGKLWKKHVDDCLEEIEMLCEHFRVGTIHIENNADKGYLKEKIRSQRPTKGYHESTNKYIKISTYLRSQWNNIWWLAGTDMEYLGEIMDYTESAEHDDAPDSAASILRAAGRRQGFVTV